MRKEQWVPKNLETARKKGLEEKIYKKILSLFKLEGIYTVARRKGILGNNLYRRIRTSAKTIVKIQELLDLADYEMIPLFIEKKDLVGHKVDWKLVKKR